MYNSQDMLERIKIEKKKKNFTNEYLAQKTGISISTLSKVLAGIVRDPSVATIIKIALALDVSADYLILGEKNNGEHPAESSKITKKYNSLTTLGKKKVETYIDDLLAVPSYNIEYKIESNYKVAAWGAKGTEGDDQPPIEEITT